MTTPDALAKRLEFYERSPLIRGLLDQSTRLRRTVATLRARLRNRSKEWERDVGDWMRAERILVNTKDQLHDAMRSADRARVERDRLQERLDQFEAYGITVDSALRDREALDSVTAALALRTKGGAA